MRLLNIIPSLTQYPELEKKLGITEEQKARLRPIAAEYWQALSAIDSAAREKTLAVPTEAQRQKLREELDRRGAW
jgi:hypothetical protein